MSRAVIYLIISLFVGRFALGQEFTDHPENQTARIGHFIDFQCRASGHGHTLKFLVNGLGLRHLDLDSRYFNTNVTFEVSENSQEFILGKFWVIANDITLKAMKYVNCNLTVINSSGIFDVSSDKAFIVDVIYPDDKECPSAAVCEVVRPSDCDMTTYSSGFHSDTLSRMLLLSLSLSFAVCVLSV